MDNPAVLYHVRDAVAWITLNRPDQRNALSGDVVLALDECLTTAEADEAVRVLCVTGAGSTFFCAGADLTSASEDGGSDDAMQSYAALLRRIPHFPKPLVARVNGHCLSGGLGLLLSCDMAYAHDGCRFATPEVGLGLFPMLIGGLLARDTARKRMMEMIFTARRYTAAEAAEMGLLTRVVPRADLDQVVNGVLADIAARAPLAVQRGRQALGTVENMPMAEALDFLCERLNELVHSEDAIEGLTAFLQKRKPVWRGR
jgi:enoyl-CoA hydratase/carnithine racemase